MLLKFGGGAGFLTCLRFRILPHSACGSESVSAMSWLDPKSGGCWHLPIPRSWQILDISKSQILDPRYQNKIKNGPSITVDMPPFGAKRSEINKRLIHQSNYCRFSNLRPWLQLSGSAQLQLVCSLHVENTATGSKTLSYDFGNPTSHNQSTSLLDILGWCFLLGESSHLICFSLGHGVQLQFHQR